MTALDANADGSTVQLTVGNEIEVALAENPTTGFRWRVRDDLSPICATISVSFIAGSQPGQPGTRIWRWRAAASGAVDLLINLARAGSEQEVRSFRVRLVVG